MNRKLIPSGILTHNGRKEGTILPGINDFPIRRCLLHIIETTIVLTNTLHISCKWFGEWLYETRFEFYSTCIDTLHMALIN